MKAVSQKGMLTHYTDIEAYTTRDGSTIRELMHPPLHGNAHQSLAEATVPCGSATLLHHHRLTEEIYHITAGEGRMRLGDAQFTVGVGDTVLIPPGTPHAIENCGEGELKLLCCCAPPYSHDDTELLSIVPLR